jgi:hypothetical protein
VGEQSRVQNKAAEITITISEQPGIAPESVQINRAAAWDLLPDDLPHDHHPHHIGHWSDVRPPAVASGAQTVRICLAQLGSIDGCEPPERTVHQPRLCRLVGPHLDTPGPSVGELRSKWLSHLAIDADSPRPPGWPAPPTQTNELRSEVAGVTSECSGVTQRPCIKILKASKSRQTSTKSNSP